MNEVHEVCLLLMASEDLNLALVKDSEVFSKLSFTKCFNRLVMSVTS